MDVHFELNGVRFVWNGWKEAANRAKHGVGFEAAAEVFFDELAVIEDASVAEEQRTAIIGLALTRTVLYVVHVERDEEAIRIISARRLQPHEQRRYEDSQ